MQYNATRRVLVPGSRSGATPPAFASSQSTNPPATPPISVPDIAQRARTARYRSTGHGIGSA
eukprot:988050-Rhodomonas_salina.2